MMETRGRVAFYSHDTMGLGHLRRCLKMAAAITDRIGIQDGLILTGSPWSGLLNAPPGFRFVSLPAVIKTGRAEYQARNPAVSIDSVIASRRAIIDRELVQFAPQLLVVDNVPCGLRGEILPALMVLRRLGTKIVLSLRDVLDDDAAIREEWDAAGAIPALRGLYDEIWLFGDHDSAAYRMIPAQLRARTIICGQLGEPLADLPCSEASHAKRHVGSSSQRPRILVTGGGGSDAGALVTTYVAALRDRRPDASHRIILGPEFPPEQVPAGADLADLGVTMIEFESDMNRAIHDADVVVSMAGYNTVCEVLAAGRRMVLVPRVWPRREQWLRAYQLGISGRAEVVHPYALDPRSLWNAVERALSRPADAPVRQDAGQRIGQRAGELLPGAHPVGVGVA